jgi:hypothetical protein
MLLSRTAYFSQKKVSKEKRMRLSGIKQACISNGLIRRSLLEGEQKS